MVGKALALMAGISLGFSPAFAQPPAQALSVQPALVQRAGAPTSDSSQLEGGSWLPAIVALAIIAGGVLLATGVIGDDDNNPVSP
jgi:hypothetical protein